VMDIQEIHKLLPHRYPFLLIDRVTEIVADKKLVGFKNVSVNEPFFMGHFPNHPVMPGVLVLEALAQACCLLAYKSTGFDPDKTVVYLMSIDGAKFRKPVVPGDRLMLTADVIKNKRTLWKQKGTATVDGQLVAEAEFLAMAVDKDKMNAAQAASAAKEG
jgi:3-hydroxyacyl-[acyl-carrier-protein] dehydratase